MSAPDFGRLRELRASRPESIADALRKRVRRPLLHADGKLFLVAADHPARGALGVQDNRMAMADRYDLLERLAVALSRPGVDGVLGTADIIDDLALLGALAGKVVAGSMNRGGLQSARFEMDDRFTGYDIPQLVDSRIDLAKLLLRINLDDPGSASTLEGASRAVDDAAAAHIPILIEPFMSRRVNGVLSNILTPDAVITSIAISAGIGNSSAYTWLKIPVVTEMERVMAATTLPTLLLGGDPATGAEETFTAWEKTLELPGVRGLVAGRMLLYPADGDVAAAVDIASSLVHAPALEHS